MGLPVPVLSGFSCDDIQLGQEIMRLSGQMNIANYRLLKMIAEFDDRGAWRCGGTVRSCAHWLAARCGMAIGAARDRVRVARRLAGLPEVDQAFSTGGLSYSKVRAITRVATEQNEGFMLAMAENASASHLEKLVGKYKPVDEFDPGSAGSLSGSAAGNHVGSDTRTDTKADASGEADDSLGSRETEAAAGPAGLASEIDEDERREQARELFWFQDKEGMWIIHAKLPPEQGQLVMKALEAFARPLQEARQEGWRATQKAQLQAVAREISRRHRATENAETEAENAGDEGTEAVGAKSKCAETQSTKQGQTETDGTAVELDALSGIEEHADEKNSAELRETELAQGKSAELRESEYADEKNSAELREIELAHEKISAESYSQFMNYVRADAFAAMAEHFLATSGSYPGFQGLKGAERCQVVLHVDINTLREQRSGVCCTHGKGHFEDRPWLSPQTARRLSCDASLTTVLEDEAGKVLNVGRRSRIVPAHIRRALMERDGVCCYPGCHESRYVDMHHIRHWAEGGETSLENLAVLCRFHHAQLHRGCFDIHRDKEQLVFATPSGRRITKESCFTAPAHK